MSASDGEALLQAILEDPDDDAPRLVYADWLDEQGGEENAARAEFIRKSIEHVRCRAAKVREGLLSRCAELLVNHRANWTPPELLNRGVLWERGFIASAVMEAEAFLSVPPHVFAAIPLQRLQLFTLDADQAWHLFQLPQMQRLVGLDLSESTVGDPICSALTSASWPALRTLNLARCGLTAPGLRMLCYSPAFAALTGLDVSGNGFGDQAPSFFANGHLGPRLVDLRMDGTDLDFVDRMHAAGAATLARVERLARLEVLDLSDQAIGDAGLASLSASLALTELRELNVAGNGIGEVGESGVEALAAAVGLPRLQRLTLSRNRLGRLGVAALARWPRLEILDWIDLRGCQLDAEVRRGLSASPHAAKFLFDPA